MNISQSIIALLIHAWAKRLELEIELLRQNLPPEMEKKFIREYIGDKIIPSLDKNPASWIDHPGDFAALAGLKVFLEELYQAHQQLKNNNLPTRQEYNEAD